MASYSEEASQSLGKTGQTVVYVFPHGGAFASRHQDEGTHGPEDKAASPPNDDDVEYLTLAEAPDLDIDAVVTRLVEQGQLTPAQVQVGHHDQASTGLNLIEALAARGWLSDDIVDGCLGQLAS